MDNKKTVLAFAVLVLAPMCWAPIEDKPKGAQFHGELTDQQLAAAQGGSVSATTPLTGSPAAEADHADIGAAPSSAEASQVVANAQAAQVLKKADLQVKGASAAKSKPFVIGGVVVLLVGGLLVGGKMWLDRAVPPSGS